MRSSAVRGDNHLEISTNLYSNVEFNGGREEEEEEEMMEK